MAFSLKSSLHLVTGLVLALSPALGAMPVEAAEVARSSGEVGLAALLERASARNPELLVTRRRLEVALARAGYAGTLEAPRLMAAIMNPLTFGGPSLTVSRSFPMGGRLAVAEEAARLEANVIEAEYRAERARVLAEVRQAYYEAIFLDKHLAIHHQVHEQLKSLLKIATARYSVGAGLQQDPLRAQLELAQILKQLNALERRFKVTTSRANTLANRPPDAPLKLEKDLPPLTAVPAEAVLVARAIASNPELQVLQAQIEGLGSQVELAKRERANPDLDVGIQVGRSMPGDMFYAGGMVGLDLPWLAPQRFEKRIEEAERTLSAAEARYQARLNELRFRISELRARMVENADQAKLYRQGIQPTALQALKSSLAAYQVGKVDFDTVIQNQNAVYEAQIGLTEALTEFNKAKAALEAQLGDAAAAKN